MFKLDLSKFKKLKSDKNTTTLQHEAGHTITIAHHALTPKVRGQLASLEQMATADESPNQQASTPPTQQQDQQSRMPQMPNMANGGIPGVAMAKQKLQHTAMMPKFAQGGTLPTYAEGTKNVWDTSTPDDPNGDIAYAKAQKYQAEKNAMLQNTNEPVKYKDVPQSKPTDYQVGIPGYIGTDTTKDLQDAVPAFADGTDNVQPAPQPSAQPMQDNPQSIVADAANPQMQTPSDTDMDPALKRKREIYNGLVTAGAQDTNPNQGSEYGSFFAGLQQNKPEAAFNGMNPPKQFDVPAWHQAEQAYAKEQADNAAAVAVQQQQVIAKNAALTAAGLPPEPVPNVPQGPQIPPSPMDQGPPPPPPTPDKNGFVDPTMEMAYNNSLKGINQQATATGGLGQARSNVFDSDIQQKQQGLSEYQNQLQKLQAEHSQFVDDVKNQHIDPQHYLNSMGTGQRIATGIGMILGGFGAGVTGGRNVAVDSLNNAINRDIDAQKTELGKNENLLSANLHQFGNLRDATEMTRLMQQGILADKLDQAAAKAASPLAKASALQAKGALQAQMAPVFQQLAMRRTMLGEPAKPGQSTLSRVRDVDPAVFVPWSGAPPEAQTQILKEIESAQNVSKSRPNILKAFDDAANTVHTADFIPGIENADQKALHTLLGPTFKDVEGTVRQAAMDNIFKNTTPQVGDNDRTKAVKRNALLGYLDSKSSAPTAKAHNIDLQTFASTSSDPAAGLPKQQRQFVDWARNHPNDPRAQVALKKLGIK